jgi:outer membrane protein assembly factor BamB
VFVPSRDTGALYAFTATGRYLWDVPTGNYVYSAPAVWEGRVYFGSYAGTLYCVSAATGAVQWELAVGGRISGSPTVVDGIVYVGDFGHRIVGADARSGRVVFSFPHGEYVAVSGNRGRLLLYGWANLWAVEPRR